MAGLEEGLLYILKCHAFDPNRNDQHITIDITSVDDIVDDDGQHDDDDDDA